MSPQRETGRLRSRIALALMIGSLIMLSLFGIASETALVSAQSFAGSSASPYAGNCKKPKPPHCPTPTPSPSPTPSPTATSIPTATATPPPGTTVTPTPTQQSGTAPTATATTVRTPTPTKALTPGPSPTATAANNSGGITGVGGFHPGGPDGGSGFPLGDALTIAALLLGLLAFLLYLLPRPGAPESLLARLRSLLIPDSLLR